MNTASALRSLIITILGALGLLTSAPSYSAPDISTASFVYRVDIRPPEEVFATGYTATGRLRTLLGHVLDGSCDELNQAEQSAWVSTSASASIAQGFIQQQLNIFDFPQATGVSGLWLYAVRPDHTFVRVPNAWNRVIADGYSWRNNYLPWQSDLLTHLAETSTVATDQEVVTPRIPASSIVYARLITSAGAGPAVQNPGYRIPATGWEDQRANLNELIPPRDIARYGVPGTSQQSCTLACDGHSGPKHQRPERAAGSSGSFYCAVQSRAAKALIGAED